MGWDQPSHWLVVLILLAVLFGYKKLPDASRAVGRSLRIFKTEIKGMGEDDRARDSASNAIASPSAVEAQSVEQAPAAPPAAPPAPVPGTDKPTTGA
ncbi:MAG: Sec-independent protein translocase subunit TatA [Jatrophihabitantaceae bacterium]